MPLSSLRWLFASAIADRLPWLGTPASRTREMMLRATGQWTPSAKSDTQYARGRWDYLARLDELARYSVLAGYVREIVRGGDLLDVGCGAGLLRQRLYPDSFGRYRGIDFEQAIQRASALRDERTELVVADMHTYTPERTFDAIVFNESIPYFSDPGPGVARYEQFLSPGGVFLISVYAAAHAAAIWEALDARYDTIDEVFLTNGAGTSWLVKAVAPRDK